ncbi:MAG: rod shape-determining protein RodA [Treponema sp.]|nr:rod shape-determining protein RodA [Treponema sp.]
MKIRNLLEIDYILLLAAVVLAVFGVLFIYSSALTSTGVLTSEEYIRQIVWVVAGLVLVLVLVMVDYRRIRGLTVYLYLGNLALLVYTCLFGKLVNGARAWIGIGSFGIQPSEFAKITTILLLARYLDDTRRSPAGFFRFIVSCLIAFIPMGIILVQPDFGTSLVFIPILVTMAFVAGVSMQYIFFLVACISITAVLTVLPLWQRTIMRNAVPALEILANSRFIMSSMIALGVIAAIALAGFLLYKRRYFFWILYSSMIVILSLGLSYVARRVLRDYQIQRLIVFLDPNVDPQGAGWHIIQSITAIGSGGLAGKGYLQGTQSHYRFLPQQSTDFIFSIFTEEWGLLGGLLVFVLFLLICLRLLRITRITSDSFGAYIAAGLAGMYVFHFLVNVGMTMGIMPITGIPLLFMSYGGSSIISAMTGIGLALSVYVRRYTH